MTITEYRMALDKLTDEYKRAADEANRELDIMNNILSIKVRNRGGCTALPDNMSSCSYYTNHTFITKS